MEGGESWKRLLGPITNLASNFIKNTKATRTVLAEAVLCRAEVEVREEGDV